MPISEEIKRDLQNAFASAVEQAVRHLDACRIAGTKFPERKDVWATCTETNGMPSFYRSWDTEADYASALGSDERPFLVTQKERLIAFVSAHDCLSKVFIDVEGAPDDDESRRDRLEMSVDGFLTELVDRYASIFGTCDFSRAQFDEVWKPRAAFCFSPTLKYQLIVPILFTKFDFDNAQVIPQVTLHRMDRETNLARAELESGVPQVNKFVVPCATHAFVFDDLELSTSYPRHVFPIHEMLGGGGEDMELPTGQVDKCFAAIRVVTGVETGYAQMLIRPMGWSNMAFGKSIPLYGYDTPQYPPHFNRQYWLKPDFPCITLADTNRLANVLTALTSTPCKPLTLAMGRLNLCSIRSSDEDMLLDAAIGLEAAITNDSNAEMTYKLAIRLGALSRLSDACTIDAYDVFTHVKALYKARSNIAHGTSNEKTFPNLRTPFGDEKPVPAAARDYLRFAILVLCEHPQYWNPKMIDKELLLSVV